MKKYTRYVLAVLLVVSLALSVPVFAINSGDENSSVNENVIYQSDEELTPTDIRDRIEKGITDVPEDKLPITATQSIAGQTEGVNMTYVGATTQLKKTVQNTDGSTISEYETTAVFDMIVNSLMETNPEVSPLSIYDGTYSIEMYIVLDYEDTLHNGGQVVKLKDILTVYYIDDSSVSVTDVKMYETSCGNMMNSSFNSVGFHDYTASPRYVGQKTSPNATMSYRATDYPATYSLTGYWIQWNSGLMTEGYVSGRAVYTITRGGSTWTGSITVRMWNDNYVEV